MRRERDFIWATLLGAVVLTRAAAQAPDPVARPTPLPLSAYAQFGTSLAQSARLGELGWSEEQFNAFLDGLRAAYRGQPIPMDAAGQRLADETGRQLEALSQGHPPAPPAAVPTPVAGAPLPPEPNAQQVAAYLQTVGKRLGLQWTADGLGYNVGLGRTGVRPRPSDSVVIACQALGADLTTALPQLSSDHFRVRMADLLPGLREGLQMMAVGSHSVFVVPAKLSFGTGPWPEGVARGAPIIFRIVLEDVLVANAAP